MGNHHNYTFGQLHLNIGHQVRLEQTRVDPNCPKFARPHPKGESVWHKQYDNDIDKADMKLYPPLGAEIEVWKRGICVARDLAKSVGMFPERGDAADGNEDLPDYPPDDGNCPEDLWWFFKPFHYHGNKIGDVLFDDGNDDDDGDDDDDDHDMHGDGNECDAEHVTSSCSGSLEGNCCPVVGNLGNLEVLAGQYENCEEVRQCAPEAAG